MRSFFAFFVVLIVFIPSAYSQSDSPIDFFSREFNWKIRIPAGFEAVPLQEWAKMEDKGAAAIEKTYDAKVGNRATTIFVYKTDQFNYIEANHQQFDSTDGDHKEMCKAVNDLFYGTFEAQMPGAVLDSSSSEETINGKVFQKFVMTVTVPGKIEINILMYSRLFGNREFTVNIMTVDKAKQQLLLDAWRNSTFGKQNQ